MDGVGIGLYGTVGGWLATHWIAPARVNAPAAICVSLLVAAFLAPAFMVSRVWLAVAGLCAGALSFAAFRATLSVKSAARSSCRQEHSS